MTRNFAGRALFVPDQRQDLPPRPVRQSPQGSVHRMNCKRVLTQESSNIWLPSGRQRTPTPFLVPSRRGQPRDRLICTVESAGQELFARSGLVHHWRNRTVFRQHEGEASDTSGTIAG